MCGIFAALQTKPTWQEDVLRRATNCLKHRGPDAAGTWQEGQIFLGHRRLAIIDLQTGGQPMFSHDERLVITFNGEIYNYRELRRELESAGHRFVTRSDTECVLEAYRRWGEGFLERIEGMFAFVLWDRERRTLFAARDRLGIKPLCWTRHQGNLLIASTLEPLYALPGLPRQLDYQAVRDLLAWEYIPSPRSILVNVHKLLPGHYFSVDSAASDPVPRPYWRVPPADAALARLDRQEAALRVETLLRQAVARQMMSEVPLGAFLSGGIDSSLVVACMAEASSCPVKTFTIGFSARAYDESDYASRVARHFQTEHTTLPAEEIQAEDAQEIIGRLDEPLADAALLPTFALSRMTRQHVTVALSGDGGDEVFGGYEKYLRAEDLGRNPWHPWSRPVKWVFDRMPWRPFHGDRFYYRTLSRHEQIPFGYAFYGNYPVFCKDLQEVLLPQAALLSNPAGFLDPWQERASKWGRRYTLDALMRTDLETYLSENCLFKTDRASMMNSLEVRVPFLDERLLQAVLPMPASMKIHNRQLKALLLPMAKRLLPREVWDRRKHGFAVPLEDSFATNWFYAMKDLLAWGQEAMPILNTPRLLRLLEMNAQHRSVKVSRALWKSLVLLMWWQTHSKQVTL